MYPDSLVALILAASTFPEQVFEANRWVQAHPHLKDNALVERRNNNPGTEREGARCISIRPCKYGQEPRLDVISRRHLLTTNLDVIDAIRVMRQRAQ